MIFTTFFVFIFVSCEKDVPDKNILSGEWIVIEFMSVESVLYPKNDGFNSVIEFRNDGTYQLKLDVNSCNGNYSPSGSGSNGISFSGTGCTEICCDSKFSQKLAELLTQINSFQVENEEMRLEISGWGWIRLELNN